MSVLLVIVFLSLLILIHEIGHFLTAKKFGLLVEEFGIGLPPRLWGKKIGETVYSLNCLPFGGFVKIYGEDRGDESLVVKSDKVGELKGPEAKSRLFNSLPAWKRMVVLSAGVLMNFLFGWLMISLVFSYGLKDSILITSVFPKSPAEEVGLLVNDRIVGFSKSDEFINFIDERRGQEITLEVERQGELKQFAVKPREEPPSGEGPLGVGLMELGLSKQGIWGSLLGGFKASLEFIYLVFITVGGLIFHSLKGDAVLNQVMGPVGIVKVTQQAGSLGFVYLVQLFGLISLNLAALNILPFPALDGGRLLFLLIEKIKGAPLPLKFEKYTNAFGMALLLFLMILITIKDIIKF